MAYISERMDDNKIQFLANEMTRTYMANKTSLSSDDFMKEYYRFYNSAQSFIAEEERKRKNSASHVSLEDIMNSALDDEPSNGRHFSF